MVPSLKHNSLLSGPKFADANYVTVLTPSEVLIFDGDNLKIQVSKVAILRGWRSKASGLWEVPLDPNEKGGAYHVLPKSATNKINSVYDKMRKYEKMRSDYHALPRSATDENASVYKLTAEQIQNVYELPSTKEVIRYLHACAGFPAKTTWMKAIRAGNYATWPHLTLQAVYKHFPESDETQQGHMRSIKQGIRSTKQKTMQEIITAETSIVKPLRKHQDVYVKIEIAKDTIYTDQTGAFPEQSKSGNRYIMILCEMDSNAILSEPMRDRKGSEIIRAYKALIHRLKIAGISPKKHILDNECSNEYKEAIRDNKMEYEFVPKGQHRRNIAEKAIQTFKAHAIGVFSGIDPKCPLSLWDLMLKQIDCQVNLLRQANAAPKVSAYAYLHGQHDFNRHPFAPLGIQVHSYVQPDKRRTWEVKSKKGHYIGTSLEHYRYYFAHISDTGGIQGSETMYFKHKYITMPTVTPADAIVQAARTLIDALKAKVPPPLAQSGADQIKQLHAILTPDTSSVDDVTERDEESAVQPVDIPAITPVDTPAITLADDEHISEGERIDDEHDLPRVRVAAAPQHTAHGHPTITQDEEDDVTPVITQEDDDFTELHQDHETREALPRWMERYIEAAKIRADTPAQNTRAKRSITDEVMLACLEVSKNISAKSAASRKFPSAFLDELAAAVLDPTTGELLEYRHLLKSPAHKKLWGGAYGKEVGRLAQGLPGVVDGTDTIDFITKDEVPPDRWKDVTYARIVCNYRPEKADPHRVRITVGGNRINYPGDCGTPTADLLLVKLLLNSVISTPGAKFMTMDISNFYLMTPLKRKEYIRLRLADMPDDVIKHYQLTDKATKDGYVYVAVKRGMYGLPQSGILAQQLLEQRLNKHGYFQSNNTPGLWTHEWRPICFTLVVDDFGVKYEGKEHAEHLASVIQENYDLTKDWEGKKYIGLTLDWDYARREVHLSMPGYISDARKRFKHMQPSRRQDSPHLHTQIIYGAKQQFAKALDDAPILSADDKLFVQQVLGTFLYYARAVDSTMLVALSAIASEQAKPTTNTLAKVMHFLDYASSQDEAILTYRASDMVLAVHSDASYLSESEARSRAGGHFFMSADTEIPPNNGAVLTTAKIIKAVMSSACEAEIGAMYINAREAVSARQALEKMGHTQPRTPMQTDNTSAHQVVTNNVQPKRTKAMDMRFHWLRYRAAQKQFRYYWRPGPTNLGDYHTKHHPGKHHQNVRAEFVTPRRVLDDLRRRQQLAKLAIKSAQGLLAARPLGLDNILARNQAASAA